MVEERGGDWGGAVCEERPAGAALSLVGAAGPSRARRSPPVMRPPPPPDAAGTVAASDGVDLAYARWHGPGGSVPTIVLIHGWSGSRLYWNSCVGELAKRAAVVAVDLRFHGRSGPARPAGGPTGATPAGAHIARLAVDLENVLTALALTDVVTVGASMGAAVLWSYSELFGRGRVRAMVFVDQVRVGRGDGDGKAAALPRPPHPSLRLRSKTGPLIGR